jgi:membrane fusion protein, heavy metal efflux system
MNFNILFIASIVCCISGCTPHVANNENDPEHEKIQLTAYTNDFEVFVETDAFIAGHVANVLSHFTVLPQFKPLDSNSVTIVLSINGTEIRQTVNKPLRKGIYQFDIKPENPGKATLRFELNHGGEHIVIPMNDATIYASDEEAYHKSNQEDISSANTLVFTKEQSWKINFATGYPLTETFGQVIKTTALIESTQGDEYIISAKANGFVSLSSDQIVEGKIVHAGQFLFRLSGGSMDGISLKYTAAANNYEKEKKEYERAIELAKDNIISDNELLQARTQYNDAKALTDNLNENFVATGQRISSPIAGFIKTVFIKNGMFVESGMPVLTITQDKSLTLRAELPQRHAQILGSIVSANIHSNHDNKTYTLEQLDGRIISYGKALSDDNYLLPVTLQIANKGSFIPGGFVEVYLKTRTNNMAITVPKSTLLEDQGIFYVWVQMTPELFEKREVSVGSTDGIRVEILKGLSTKERIVTQGALMLKLAQATGTLDAHSGHVH